MMTKGGRAPVWWSLCCGLDAVSCLAMIGEFAPISRMGGKRQVADVTLRLIGDHPRVWRMIDADPAIVDFWRLCFSGQMRYVADIIAGYELDEKELYDSLKAAPVPDDEEERVAAWCCLQRANYYGKPVTVGGGKWSGLAGFCHVSESAYDAGYGKRLHVRFLSSRLRELAPMRDRGAARLLDLATEMPDFRPGDLVTMDPPYKGTQGYSSDLPRDRVVEIARAADAAGARVLLHESTGLVGLDGWDRRMVRSGERAGGRTWAATPEWVTFNFEPAQMELFDEGAEVAA